jgi:hypothetical protein
MRVLTISFTKWTPLKLTIVALPHVFASTTAREIIPQQACK